MYYTTDPLLIQATIFFNKKLSEINKNLAGHDSVIIMIQN